MRRVAVALKALAGLVSVLVLAVSCASVGPSSSPASGPSPSARQFGLALPAYDLDAYDDPALRSYLADVRDLGAGWVQIVPHWFQSDIDSSEIRRTPMTVTDDGVVRVIELARVAGLKVLLKPQVNVEDGSFRGKIEPADVAEWFTSYTGLIAHYATLADRYGVDQFAVGTELAGVSGNRDRWLEVVRDVRERYRGPVLYAANYDEYRQVAFWDAVDVIGIDAYWPLSDVPTRDETALRTAWEPIRKELADYAERQRRKILFTEAGYTSQRGTTTSPFSPRVSSTPDQLEQSAAYRALLDTFDSEPWWAGVMWWYSAIPGADPARTELDYSIDGKESEDVLRGRWR